MSRLFVGVARVDISPEESVPLSGFGRSSNRMSQGVSDPLSADCLAFSDEKGGTMLVFSLDQGNMYAPLPSFREDVAQATGLTKAQIMFSATHTHSAPHLSNRDEPTIPRYCEKLRRCLVECAVAAMADRRETTLSVGSIRTRNMNFVRRYVLADGTYAGDNYGHPKLSPIARHESDADPMLQVIKFTREGGKDILMTNFQGHPHKGAKYKYYHATSDLVYYYRQTLEEETGCHAVYFSGASGNVNCTSRIPEENITADYMEHGRALAHYALEALKNLRAVTQGDVKHLQHFYVGKCNHTEDYKLEAARIVAERWNAGAKTSEALAGYEDLFTSAYHANAVITKAGRPLTADVELNGISFGEVGMVFAPFELFSELGEQIKANSPFDTTFVCCYSNALFSYMPTKLGFEHGGYGPGACRFEPGTGEILVEEFTKILNTLSE